MKPISFTGVASGLPRNLVEQIIQAEREPINRLEERKSKSESKLGLINDLDGKLNDVQSVISVLDSRKGFDAVKLISGDPNIVQGTVDPELVAKGSYNVEVVELAQRAAAITNGFPDKDRSEIGVGYFVFETKDGDREVFIDSSNNTLAGAATAINRAGLGVRATVINDRKDPDAPFKLMLSGSSVGGDHSISYPTLYFLDGDQDIYFDEKRDAKNGIIKVDGIEFQIGDNTVEDIIPGVTLELKQASPGRTVNLTVKEDQAEITAKIKDFVDNINKVLSFIQSQLRVDANTDTSNTLGGESFLRNLENRLRRLIQSPMVGVGEINRLGQIGVSFNRAGTLDYDADKFNTILAKNPERVQQFFAGDGFEVGFIPSLKRTLADVRNSAFGPVAMRKKSLQDNIRRIDDQIASKEKRLEKQEESLRRKFGKLEETVSRLKGQGGALAGIGGGGLLGG